MKQAQRRQKDFDGIAAGYPAINPAARCFAGSGRDATPACVETAEARAIKLL